MPYTPLLYLKMNYMSVKIMTYLSKFSPYMFPVNISCIQKYFVFNCYVFAVMFITLILLESNPEFRLSSNYATVLFPKMSQRIKHHFPFSPHIPLPPSTKVFCLSFSLHFSISQQGIPINIIFQRPVALYMNLNTILILACLCAT